FEGGPELLPDQPVDTIVLDGQQRLTSLYNAISGTGPHRYYLNISMLRDGAELEDAISSSHTSRRSTRELEDPRAQYEQLILPFGVIRNRSGFGEWKRGARWYWTEKEDHPQSSILELERFLDHIDDTFISNIEHYRVPVLLLSDQV